MSYWVYIIESQKDHSYYIGSTSNLERRFEQHNLGESRYTSQKMPWKLAYFEEYQDKTSALKREIFLKKQKNLKFYKALIATKQ
jgi:putative endonuclease